MATDLRTPPLRVHGRRTPEYGSWCAMITRCENPNHDNYPRYGGRGIKICPRWRGSFAAFFEDMGPRPPGHTLDRRQSNKDYEPSNCRWATPLEQSHNSSNPRFYTLNGETLCISEWARRIGIRHERMRRRIRDYPLEIALTTLKGESCKEAAEQEASP